MRPSSIRSLPASGKHALHILACGYQLFLVNDFPLRIKRQKRFRITTSKERTTSKLPSSPSGGVLSRHETHTPSCCNKVREYPTPSMKADEPKGAGPCLEPEMVVNNVAQHSIPPTRLPAFDALITVSYP
jgi:hypothetical protein